MADLYRLLHLLQESHKLVCKGAAQAALLDPASITTRYDPKCPLRRMPLEEVQRTVNHAEDKSAEVIAFLVAMIAGSSSTSATILSNLLS
jgi:hypothetical protein